VLCNDNPYDDENSYNYMTSTANLSAIHTEVGLFRDSMFYRVIAVKFNRECEGGILATLRDSDEKITWGEVKNRLDKARTP